MTIPPPAPSPVPSAPANEPSTESIPNNDITTPTVPPTFPTTTTTTKPHGRAFYTSLGSPTHILAPMVEHSHLAWRLLTKLHSPSHKTLCYTPMFHAKQFASSPAYIQHNFPAAFGGLDGTPVDRPLFVQFCANDPDALLDAALKVVGHADAVDLNLGCPQGIARRGRYGAFLQEEWELIYSLINKLHQNLPIPITAKIRILESKERTLEYARMVLSAGASILTVHGRTREQKAQFTGLADWSYLRFLRDNLPPETVLFANGNIQFPGDVERCLEATGFDAVMSAEGNLHNPAGIFQPPDAGPLRWFPRVDEVCREYLSILRRDVVEHLPTPKTPPKVTAPVTDQNLTAAKAHLFKLLHAFLPLHTDVRALLARSRAVAPGNAEGVDVLRDFEKVVEAVESVVRGHLEKEDEGPDGGCVRKEDGSWVVPWWRCQPYIRPSVEEAKKAGAIGQEGEGKKKKKEKRGERRGEKRAGEELQKEECKKGGGGGGGGGGGVVEAVALGATAGLEGATEEAAMAAVEENDRCCDC